MGEVRSIDVEVTLTGSPDEEGKKPAYTEPAVGWNDEDFKTGITKFGVTEYAAPTTTAVSPPARPTITFEHDDDATTAVLDFDALEEMLRLM